jgi:hypothetical protein
MAALALWAAACDDKATSGTSVTKVNKYEANLPPVPTIPAVNVPETYPDSSYSIFGLRRNKNKALNSVVEVTGYIVKIYEKRVCAEGQTCPSLMPHLFLADEPNEPLAKRHIKLVGYAQNFQEMEDAKANAESGREPEALPEGVTLAPVVWDWQLGKKYKITATFTRQSSAGFMDTEGLLDYKAHTCLDCPPPDTDAK